MAKMESMSEEPPRKKKRLNHACDRCRARKVRCDDRLPECTNCLKAKATCVTHDPKVPSTTVVRREAQSSLPPPSIGDSHSPELDISPNGRSDQSPAKIPAPSQTHLEAAVDSRPLPSLPRFKKGNSAFVITQWLDLAFTRLNHSQRFSHVYRDNRFRQCFDLDKPCPINATQILELYRRPSTLTYFMTTIHSVFPMFSPAKWSDLGQAQATGSGLSLTSVDVLRAAVCATLAPHSEDTDSWCSLHFALSHMALLLCGANLDSIVALILMAMALRARNESDVASHLISLAVAISRSIDLGRSDSILGSETKDSEEEARIWWSLFVLDAIIAIELESVPHMVHTESFPELPDKSAVETKPLYAMCSLAKIQSEIIQSLINQRRAESYPGMSLEQLITTKVGLAGEMDSRLSKCIEAMPRELRPSEFIYCEDKDLPWLSLLSIQYWQTLFLIFRNSLIVGEKHVATLIDRHFSDSHFRHRIQNSRTICSGAARSIVNILSHVHDRGLISVHDTLHGPLVACMGLAISILRRPWSSTVKADLELYATAVTFLIRRRGTLAAESITPPVELSKHFKLLGEALKTHVHQADQSSNQLDSNGAAAGNGGSRELVDRTDERPQAPLDGNLDFAATMFQHHNLTSDVYDLFNDSTIDWQSLTDDLDLSGFNTFDIFDFTTNDVSLR